LVYGGLDGIGPDRIAVAGWKGGIDQGITADRTVRLKKLVSKIEIDHLFAVSIAGDDFVDRFDLVPRGVGGTYSMRPDALEDNGRFRTSVLILGDVRLNPLGDLFRGIGIDVIASDLEDDELGVQTINLAMLQAPEDGLGGISPAAKIKSVQLTVTVPHASGRAIVTRGDRPLVAIENEVNFGHLPRILEVLFKII